MSFGTVLGEIDENATETMAAVFSSLPQRVIWKPNTGTGNSMFHYFSKSGMNKEQ